MKRIKKIAVLAIIFIMSTVLNVYAADTNAVVTLTPNTSTVKVGETFTIELSANCATGVEGIDSTLEWDKSKLELKSFETKQYYSSFSDTDGETGKFILSALYGDIGAPEEAPEETNFGTLTFLVLDTVTVNEVLDVKLTDIKVIDTDVNSHDATEQKVSLTVVEEPEGEESGDGASGDGASGDGALGDGASGDGALGDGASGDGALGDGASGNGEQGDGAQNGKDNTISGNTINHAGIESYAVMLLAGIIITIALYVKCRKYKDVI